MSKEEWVSEKIAKLIDEGKSRDQAVAIANSMWEDEHKRAEDKHKELSEAVEDLQASIAPIEDATVTATPAPKVETMTVAADLPEVKAFDTLDDKTLFERIWDRVSERIGRKQDDATGFKVAGNHWLAVWSNNFKDRDDEIFTAKAMSDYAARVDMGITPAPHLWVWHVGKQVDIGKAAWVGTHGHFMMAAGEFDTNPQAQAAQTYYGKHAKDTGISHGFTFPSDQFSDKQYHQFNTFEISLLPRGAEANLYTSLEGVKAMALNETKVKYLKDVFGEEHATRILAEWEARGKALEDLGVEFKDFTAPTPAANEAAANKEAVEHADKAFGDLLTELLESSAEPVTAALEAVKAVKAMREELDTRIKAMEANYAAAIDAQKPRIASQDAQTAIKESALPSGIKDVIAEQKKVVDTFWGDVAPSNGNHGG